MHRRKKGKYLGSNPSNIWFWSKAKATPARLWCIQTSPSPEPPTHSCLSLLHNSPACRTDSFWWWCFVFFFLWYLIRNWITLLILGRSNHYTDLFGNFFQQAASRGSISKPSRQQKMATTARSSFITKKPTQGGNCHHRAALWSLWTSPHPKPPSTRHFQPLVSYWAFLTPRPQQRVAEWRCVNVAGSQPIKQTLCWRVP